MIIVYSENNSSRLSYTLDYVFKHILQTDYKLINDLDEAKKSAGPLINYSDQAVGRYQIVPAKILFETNLRPLETFYKLEDEKHLLLFEDPESKHFDLFAAIFFMLSRYEEQYHPRTDHHGRQLPECTWMGINGLLKLPVVDIWLNEFTDELNSLFKLELKKPAYSSLSTVDLDNGYKYKGKDFKRIAGGFLKDIKSLDFKNMKRRLLTISGLRKDDFDIYDWLINYHKETKLPLHFFILNARRSNHDRGLPKNSKAIKALVDKFKSNNIPFGIHPSYSSNRNHLKLDSELNGLRSLAERKITSSRQHYLKFNLSTTFQNLVDLGIEDDYSMGFAPQSGFRAGTSRTFYFFSVPTDKATPLLMHPITVMEGTYKDYLRTRPSIALLEIKELIDTVKTHGGTFMSIWHEAQLANNSPWRRIYLDMNEAVAADLVKE